MASKPFDAGPTTGGRWRRTSDAAFAVALVAVAGLASLATDTTPFSQVNPNTDSGVFVYIGRHVLAGQMPYLDVFDHKGPLLYLLNALAALGPDKVGLWLVEWAAMAAAVLLLFFALRRVVSRGAAFLGVAVACLACMGFLLGGNYAEQFAMPFEALGVSCLLSAVPGVGALRPPHGPTAKAGEDAGRAPRHGATSDAAAESAALAVSPSKPRLLLDAFGAGAAVGCCLMLKPTTAVGLCVMALFVLVVVARDRGVRAAVECVALAAVGVLATVGPMLAWLVLGGAFDAFVDCYLHFNSEYMAAANRVHSLLGVAFWELRDPTAVVSVVLGLVVVAVACGRRRTNSALLWAGVLVAMLGAVLASALSHDEYVYYQLCWPVFGAVLMAGGFDLLLRAGAQADEGRESARGSAAAWAVAILLACLLTAGSVSQGVSAAAGYARGVDIWGVDAKDPDGQQGIVDAVERESAPDDKIVVYAHSEAWVLDATHRDSASRYIFTPDQGRDWITTDQVFQDVQAEHPKLVVVPTSQEDEVASNLRGLPGYDEVYRNSAFVLYKASDAE